MAGLESKKELGRIRHWQEQKLEWSKDYNDPCIVDYHDAMVLVGRLLGHIEGQEKLLDFAKRQNEELKRANENLRFAIHDSRVERK